MRSIIIAVTTIAVVYAQEHLVPEPGVLAEYDEYDFKVREVFTSAYSDEVVCKVVILGSFGKEQVVGLRTTAGGHEIFSMFPSSSIWDTELVRLHESGQIQSYAKDGKKLTLEQDDSYQDLKKRTPADFRQITIETQAVPLGDSVAHRIAAIWERMLLDTRQPKQWRQGLDGASYHFSMFVSGRGIISGQIWSPKEKTKTAALEELAYALSQYAMRRTDLDALKKIVNRVDKITKA
jgi:hypothetical protein